MLTRVSLGVQFDFPNCTPAGAAQLRRMAEWLDTPNGRIAAWSALHRAWVERTEDEDGAAVLRAAFPATGGVP